MRPEVIRGKLLYLTVDGHKRVKPFDTPAKIGKRPFLVIQRDAANASSDTTLVVGTSTSPLEKVVSLSKVKIVGTEAFLPGGREQGLKSMDSFADCGDVFTVYDAEIREVLKGLYLSAVMQYVDQALRIALDIDPSAYYQNDLPPMSKR